MPESVRAMVEAAQKAKPAPNSQAETVEEIVPPASEIPYEQKVKVQRRIPLDSESLRTFVVTREILGPARFRNPHRPGIQGR